MKVGILGGGQLGRMLALAGHPLGLEFRFLDPSPEAPARHVGHLVCAAYDDREALARFADGLDVVTFEFENVPVGSLEFLASRVRVAPTPAALGIGQDRFAEKSTFTRLGIATNAFAVADSAAGFVDAAMSLGLPAVVKTRRMGYDGKGQWVARTREELERIAAAVSDCRGLIAEAHVPFQRELSILSVRSQSGETRFYDLVQNYHAGGILRESLAPAPNLSARLVEQARGAAARLLEHTHYVGVLAIELFDVDGRLLANEIAPRVHNSGHWTIEGAAISQFENHLRAVCGLPLGSTATVGASAMLNLIGEAPATAGMLAVEGAHVHLYGKSARPGRKIGHVTIWAETPEELTARRRDFSNRVGVPA